MSDLGWLDEKYDDDSDEEASPGIFSFETTENMIEVREDKLPPSYEEALKMLPVWNGKRAFHPINEVI